VKYDCCGYARMLCITLMMLQAPAVGLAQSPVGQATVAPAAGLETVEGTVREIFLNRFIFESGTSRYLVEPVGTAGHFPLVADERVAVSGRRTGTLLQATRITRPNGEVIHDSPPSPSTTLVAPPVAASPQGQSQLQIRPVADVLAGLDLQPLGEAVRKKHHTEILARLKDGRSVYVSFDLAGRLWEIEDADYDRDRVSQQVQMPEHELFRCATEAGFKPVGPIERKKRHAVVSAINRSGDMLELHIDFAGYIYKQVWPR
jgi:hypothetical protein